MILILATLFVILFLGWFYIRTRKPKNFPPGPPRFPIVGSLPYMMGSGDAPSLLFGVSEQVVRRDSGYPGMGSGKIVFKINMLLLIVFSEKKNFFYVQFGHLKLLFSFKNAKKIKVSNKR